MVRQPQHDQRRAERDAGVIEQQNRDDCRTPEGRTANGREHPLPRAFGRGASDAQLITRYATDPLMGGTGININFVTIERGA